MELEDKYELGIYPKRGIQIVRGKGAKIYDSNGKEYIDCVAGHGVALIGHGNQEVAEAVYSQAKEIISIPQTFYHEKRAKLEEKLVSITPDSVSKVFLCNSGTESVEAAMKFARAYTGKKEIFAAMKAFHGRTMGALSATWKEQYRKPFLPLIPGVKHFPFNNIDAFRESISDDTAAVMLEIVQGEGGIIPAEKDFLREVREICTEKEILLIADEVQTGFGRTGKMFASEHYSLQPDILCLAKGIAGGIPMGATLLREDMQFDKLIHGTTFGGNPLSCAASLATINFIEKNKLVEKSAENGARFLEMLAPLKENSKVREIRGLGLMTGIELKEKPREYISALAEKSVLILPAGLTVMRYLPPLVISESELRTVANATIEVLQ